jgi:hypothetical protein
LVLSVDSGLSFSAKEILLVGLGRAS